VAQRNIWTEISKWK